MNDVVVKIEDLSKLYRLGEVGTGTMSHDINRWWARIRGKEDPFSMVGQINDRTHKAESDYVWALKDINLDFKRGEIVGIIGRNGAGKSTLLKLISRITAPTKGEIKAKGRIASLLEVGTGMHPEMTAKENIFLNGAIMGMTKAEIRKEFDDIIDFAGCNMYVDTPIKRFSSGMRVRLGFAVAAFLKPDILIVDEVLAVGDAEFQKKAIGKMKEVSSESERTVLFVSHNMGSIQNLCTRAIVIDKGMVGFDGPTIEGIQYYLSEGGEGAYQELSERTDREGTGLAMFTNYRIEDVDGKVLNYVISGQSISLAIDYVSKSDDLPVNITIHISTPDGIVMSSFSSRFSLGHSVKLKRSGTIHCEIEAFPYPPGKYILSFRLRSTDKNWLDIIENAAEIIVEKGDFFNTGKVPPDIKWGLLVRHNMFLTENKQVN